LNNKEQVHKAFKLLIVVIVAVVLLVIVIFGILNLPIQTDDWGTPLSKIRSLLIDLDDSSGALKYSSEVVFRPGDVLTASTLVERLSISQDQICMSTGQFAEDFVNGFECIGCEDASDNQRLVYHGSSNQVTRIAVVCDVNLEELNNGIEEYKLENGEGGWEGTSIKDACRVCEGKGKCCAFVLERS